MTATNQIAGYSSGNIAEVESLTKALRATLRPEDTGALGAFSVAAVSGTIGAGLAAASRVFSFRWADSSRFALIKRVVLSVGSDATAFTGGTCVFNLFRVVSFSVGDTTGRTDCTPTGNQNKLRVTGQGTTLLTNNSICISTTAAISGGTLTTPDTNPLATNVVGIVATAGTIILTPQYPLFEQRPGEHPLLLAANEGFMIQATVPISGTWKFGVKTDWSEVTAY